MMMAEKELKPSRIPKVPISWKKTPSDQQAAPDRSKFVSKLKPPSVRLMYFPGLDVISAKKKLSLSQFDPPKNVAAQVEDKNPKKTTSQINRGKVGISKPVAPATRRPPFSQRSSAARTGRIINQPTALARRGAVSQKVPPEQKRTVQKSVSQANRNSTLQISPAQRRNAVSQKSTRPGNAVQTPSRTRQSSVTNNVPSVRRSNIPVNSTAVRGGTSSAKPVAVRQANSQRKISSVRGPNSVKQSNLKRPGFTTKSVQSKKEPNKTQRNKDQPVSNSSLHAVRPKAAPKTNITAGPKSIAASKPTCATIPEIPEHEALSNLSDEALRFELELNNKGMFEGDHFEIEASGTIAQKQLQQELYEEIDRISKSPSPSVELAEISIVGTSEGSEFISNLASTVVETTFQEQASEAAGTKTQKQLHQELYAEIDRITKTPSPTVERAEEAGFSVITDEDSEFISDLAKGTNEVPSGEQLFEATGTTRQKELQLELYEELDRITKTPTKSLEPPAEVASLSSNIANNPSNMESCSASKNTLKPVALKKGNAEEEEERGISLKCGKAMARLKEWLEFALHCLSILSKQYVFF